MAEKSMDEPTKELYLQKVEKYNEETKSAGRTITTNCIFIGIVALYIINLILGLTNTPPPIAAHISMTGILITALLRLIVAILTKIEMSAKIEGIQELLAVHGFVLEDEIEKAKGM